ncbi:hypothetical protein BJV78DRAFT_1164216 [Lactifluus subvellereus]|nr:hypothetical protein BJV78DRAFT_1164216 [Lactifluus subvellereus]
MSSEDPPLPYGWVREFDPSTSHPFWVDTTVDPPRAIWTHPYEDEQYLREHPDVREKVGNLAEKRSSKQDPKPTRRHSFNGRDSDTMVPDDDGVVPDLSNKGKNKRGFLGKLKDKAIGTKEERAAMKREQARVRTLGVRCFCQLSYKPLFT